MNDEARPQRRDRPAAARRRRPAPPGAAPGLRSPPQRLRVRRLLVDLRRPVSRGRRRAGLNLADLQAKPLDELRELAGEHGIEGADDLEHSDLVLKLLDVVPLTPTRREPERITAARHRRRDPRDRRRGLRLPARPRRDAVERRHLRQLQPGAPLRRCAPATGSPARPAPPKEQEKYWGLLRVDTVNGVEPEVARRRPYFDTAGAGLPGRDVRHRDGPEEPDPAPHQPHQPHRQGPARPDPLARPRRARRRSSSTSPPASPTTTPRRSSWSPSSASGPRRSPTCSAASRARSTPRPSTSRPRTTPAWPR